MREGIKEERRREVEQLSLNSFFCYHKTPRHIRLHHSILHQLHYTAPNFTTPHHATPTTPHHTNRPHHATPTNQPTNHTTPHQLTTPQHTNQPHHATPTNYTRFPIEEAPTETCAICWEPLHQARKLPCSHLFHKSVCLFRPSQV